MTVFQAIKKILKTGKYKCSSCGNISKVKVISTERETAIECKTCGAILASCMKIAN